MSASSAVLATTTLIIAPLILNAMVKALYKFCESTYYLFYPSVEKVLPEYPQLPSHTTLWSDEKFSDRLKTKVDRLATTSFGSGERPKPTKLFNPDNSFHFHTPKSERKFRRSTRL